MRQTDYRFRWEFRRESAIWGSGPPSGLGGRRNGHPHVRLEEFVPQHGLCLLDWTLRRRTASSKYEPLHRRSEAVKISKTRKGRAYFCAQRAWVSELCKRAVPAITDLRRDSETTFISADRDEMHL